MLSVMDRGKGNYAARVGSNSPHYQNPIRHFEYFKPFKVRSSELKLLHQLMYITLIVFLQRLCFEKPDVNYC